MKNIKGFLKVVASVGMVSSVLAVNDPNWERPIMEAKVDFASQGHSSFEGAQNIKITLHQKTQHKSPTSISVNFDSLKQNDISIALAITQIRDDECGSVTYVAQKFFNGLRQSITLIDNSKRHEDCEPAAATWLVQVREGGGFCGTMDSTMTLEAEPTPVYTIAQIINPILDR